jgi:hypothetical protein
MAALAIPAIEVVATRVLVALGIGVASAEAGKEVARQRREAAEKAAATPLAKADACTQGDRKPACKDCPPDRGAFSHQSTAGWSAVAIAYQQRICSMPPAPMPGCLTEWRWMGIDFDGFESSQCLLKEAKSSYDQFFAAPNEFRYPFQQRIFQDMLVRSVAQDAVAQPKPPVQLHWHFMEPMSFAYMAPRISRMAPQIRVIFQP